VISHVVLFSPRATLTTDERAALIESLKGAVTGIPAIKRTTIGKRVLLNRPGYETAMAEHYEYSAILEFDSEADLRAYLDHPAHNNLGRLLFTALKRACLRLRLRQSRRLEVSADAIASQPIYAPDDRGAVGLQVVVPDPDDAGWNEARACSRCPYADAAALFLLDLRKPSAFAIEADDRFAPVLSSQRISSAGVSTTILIVNRP
jgi:hypothetical protein